MDGQDEMEWNDMKFPYVWSFCHRIFGFAFRTLISVPEQVLSRKTSILKCREDFWAKFSFAELKLLRCQEILQWQAKGGGWEYSESKSGSNSLKLENFTHRNQEKHVKKIMNSWIQTSTIFSRKQVSAPVWNINIMNHKLPWRPTADLKCLKFWLMLKPGKAANDLPGAGWSKI